MTISDPYGSDPDHQESTFVPEYQPPAWYLNNDPARNHTPWYSVAESGHSEEDATDSCQLCHAGPATWVCIRSHQGLALFMRWKKLEGTFCSTCGIKLVRRMTKKTLRQGWWGPFSLLFGMPFTLVSNLLAHRELKRLKPASPRTRDLTFRDRKTRP